MNHQFKKTSASFLPTEALLGNRCFLLIVFLRVFLYFFQCLCSSCGSPRFLAGLRYLRQLKYLREIDYKNRRNLQNRGKGRVQLIFMILWSELALTKRITSVKSVFPFDLLCGAGSTGNNFVLQEPGAS